MKIAGFFLSDESGIQSRAMFEVPDEMTKEQWKEICHQAYRDIPEDYKATIGSGGNKLWPHAQRLPYSPSDLFDAAIEQLEKKYKKHRYEIYESIDENDNEIYFLLPDALKKLMWNKPYIKEYLIERKIKLLGEK